MEEYDAVRLHPEYIITFTDYSEVISVGQCAAGHNQFTGQWFTGFTTAHYVCIKVNGLSVEAEAV